jgi:hypothetical protein
MHDRQHVRSEPAQEEPQAKGGKPYTASQRKAVTPTLKDLVGSPIRGTRLKKLAEHGKYARRAIHAADKEATISTC